MVKVTVSNSFKNEVLDRYLEMGWFRMYDHMFTTDTIEDEDNTFNVYWFRYLVPSIVYGRRQKDLCNKNKSFTLSFQPLVITDELENLFSLYKCSKPFVGYDSLENAFGSGFGVFDTWVVRVRNPDKQLIAAGIFDKGSDSIAGIMNIYNPAYEKHSLGKFLLLAKIYYCRKFGIEWYYPGYIMREPSKFDYKLFPDKASSEVLVEETGMWVPYNTWKDFDTKQPEHS